ncbi:MAG: hypothetical protein GXP19_07790 [Gammaproteobacteria bacterium]|nr:hypothetical protein [Gammaproteobacteria bacterium]
MNLIKTLSVLTLAAAMSYGCSNDSSTPSPNGIYSGTITGGLGAPSNGGEKGIIYNGRMMVFSTAIDIQSFFDSQLTVVDTGFTATLSIYDNSFPVASTADLAGTFVHNTSVTATFINTTDISITDGTINLTANTSLYNKNSSAATVTGSWQGTHGNVRNATSLTIDGLGVIAGNDVQGCNFTGTISPADTSINVYNVSITSTGGVGCTSLPAATYTGLAWTEGANDTILNLTIADGTNARAVILTKN